MAGARPPRRPQIRLPDAGRPVLFDGALADFNQLAALVPGGIGRLSRADQSDERLAQGLTLAIVDLRGGGRSTGEATALSFDVLADDLEAVRRDIGVERVVVLGHSILGALAVEYARRCPAS